jgi:hypothetical protein
MSTTDQGKFCDKCSKNVIDFSSLTDNELVKALANSTGQICGRLNKTQINRLVFQTNTKPSISQNYKFIASLILFGSTSTAIAKTDNINSLFIYKKDKFANIDVDSSKTIISGQVIDSVTKEVLPGAVIIIQGTNIGTTADLDGKFKLNLSDFTSSDKITLEITYIAYKKKVVSLSKSEIVSSQNLLMLSATEMSPEETQLTGDICIVDKSHKKKWWQFWRRL